jgi:hypothetical protein
MSAGYQEHFRLRNDTEGEVSNGSDWLAAQDAVPSYVQLNTTFRVRFSVAAVGGPKVETLALYASTNGSTWSQVTSSSSLVKFVASSQTGLNGSTGVTCTNQLSLTGTFQSGGVVETSHCTNNYGFSGTISGSKCVEVEFCIQALSAGTLYLRVQNGSSALDYYISGPTLFICSTAPAESPVVTTASLTGSSLGEVQVTWPALTDATAYDVQSSPYANMSGASTLASGQSQLSYTDSPSGPSYYQVRGKNPIGAGAWSSPTLGTPTPPAEAPAAAAAAAPAMVVLGWPPLADALVYDVQSSATSNMASPTSVATGLTANDQLIATVTAAYYQVRGRNNNAAGAWSSALLGTPFPASAAMIASSRVSPLTGFGRSGDPILPSSIPWQAEPQIVSAQPGDADYPATYCFYMNTVGVEGSPWCYRVASSGDWHGPYNAAPAAILTGQNQKFRVLVDLYGRPVKINGQCYVAFLQMSGNSGISLAYATTLGGTWTVYGTQVVASVGGSGAAAAPVWIDNTIYLYYWTGSAANLVTIPMSWFGSTGPWNNGWSNNASLIQNVGTVFAPSGGGALNQVIAGPNGSYVGLWNDGDTNSTLHFCLAASPSGPFVALPGNLVQIGVDGPVPLEQWETQFFRGWMFVDPATDSWVIVVNAANVGHTAELATYLTQGVLTYSTLAATTDTALTSTPAIVSGTTIPLCVPGTYDVRITAAVSPSGTRTLNDTVTIQLVNTGTSAVLATADAAVASSASTAADLTLKTGVTITGNTTIALQASRLNSDGAIALGNIRVAVVQSYRASPDFGLTQAMLIAGAGPIDDVAAGTYVRPPTVESERNMLYLAAGSTYRQTFTVKASSGALVAPDSTPTISALHNLAADSTFSATLAAAMTNPSTGVYEVAATVPSYSSGDQEQVWFQATLGGVALAPQIDEFQIGPVPVPSEVLSSAEQSELAAAAAVSPPSAGTIATAVAADILATPANKLSTDASGNVTLVSAEQSELAAAAAVSPPSAASIATAVAADILATPANKLATDASGNVTLVSAEQSELAAAAAVSPPSAGTIATAVAADILATPANKLATDASGNVTLVSAEQSELAAAAAVSPPSAVQIREEIDANSTQLAAIVARTNLITSGNLVIASGIGPSGAMTLYKYACYDAATGVVTCTNPGNWPSFPSGSTVTLVVWLSCAPATPVLTVAGTIVDANTVTFAPQLTDMAALQIAPNQYAYAAVLNPGGDTTKPWPLATGNVVVERG